MNESVQTEDREQIVEAIWNRARKTLPKMMSPDQTQRFWDGAWRHYVENDPEFESDWVPPIFSEKIEDFLVYVELHDKNGKMLWFGWQPSATVIYRETMGRDPKGQVVRLCGDPQCEDPIHLWDVGSEGPPPNSVHLCLHSSSAVH